MKAVVPLMVFIVLVVVLSIGLNLDPREVPSPYIDKPAPGFLLPELFNANQSVTEADLKGKVWLLNVWASWCGACRAEHGLLSRLVSQSQVPIVGLDYKDDNYQAKQWLQQLGNPYVMVAVDQQGKAGIDWGVYGVPETFVIDKSGVIRYKSIGPVTQEDWDEHIFPLIKKLNQKEVNL